MNVLILEGPRGVGKTTQARNIRQKISEITLVNPTGFHLDGDMGYDKITEYYNSWLDFISSLKYHDSTFVFDRFFFTEQVFSPLYKDYDFSRFYNQAVRRLHESADKVTIVFLTINDEDELKERLVRDKVPFGKAKESVEETMRQQESYSLLMSELSNNYAFDSKFKVITLDTTGKTPEQVETELHRIVSDSHE
jgi:thymidylate kinase